MTRQVVLWIWAVLAAGLVCCEIAALVTRGRVAGLGQLFAAVSARRWSLLASFVAWMWLGWHFFAR
ncbi:MAG TPA: DUF6186 family protein [Acidimicrobiales bacterium]|nr:DUF6186 family protein [Acidimicrobiales bacterium]